MSSLRALLLSNSTNAGGESLAHAREAIAAHLQGVDTLVFVPYALADLDGYTAGVRAALAGIVEVVGAHTLSVGELEAAEAFYVGGGNTFRLLKRLQETGALELLRRAAQAGVPYMGASAGTCVTGPSIRTTNDMPIVEPDGFTGLGLVPWHLNCHFLDAERQPQGFMGETRERRLEEFLEENAGPVICLREGAWLEVSDGRAQFGGAHGGKRFARGRAPEELAPDALLTWE